MEPEDFMPIYPAAPLLEWVKVDRSHFAMKGVKLKRSLIYVPWIPAWIIKAMILWIVAVVMIIGLRIGGVRVIPSCPTLVVLLGMLLLGGLLSALIGGYALFGILRFLGGVIMSILRFFAKALLTRRLSWY